MFEHQIGERGFVDLLATGVVRRLRPGVGPVLQNGFEEAGGQRLPLAPRRGRQTVKLFAETAEQIFERERAGAVERAVER